MDKLAPNRTYKIGYSIVLGCLCGIFIFGVYASRVHSYFSDEPTGCLNCHIMNPFYITWFHSSHREHTTCNDCHIPQGNVVKSLWFKLNDGLRHSTLFTLNEYPQVIRLRDAGAMTVQENCIRCHQNQISYAFDFVWQDNYHNKQEMYCWNCHREVPHGRISSQASTPYGLVPVKYNLAPEWLKNNVKK